MIPEYTQHIAVLSVCLHIPAAQSLKSKRMVIKSIKDKIRSRFNVSVAEMDGHDKWQIAVCDIAMVGLDQRRMDRCLQNILALVESRHEILVTDYKIEFF